MISIFINNVLSIITGNWFCSHPNVHCNFNYGHSFGRGTFRFSKGAWQNIGERITLNTPGQKDGSMSIIYKGRTVYTISGLTFRTNRLVHIYLTKYTVTLSGALRIHCKCQILYIATLLLNIAT